MVNNNYLLFSLLIPALSVTADTDINQSSIGNSNNLSVDTTSITNQLKVWGINPEDWTRYQQIMQNKGKFLWKDLDPITVLGLNARNASERKRYAKQLAKQEYENTQKVVLLDRAFDIEFKKLYGHIPVVDPSKLNISSAKASLLSVPKAEVKAVFGDRYIAFVNTRCDACNSMIQQALDSIDLGVSLDIHFKNDSRQAITQWATQQNIRADSVEIGTITLNPDSDLYEKFGQPAEPALFYFNKATNQVNEVK